MTGSINEIVSPFLVHYVVEVMYVNYQFVAKY